MPIDIDFGNVAKAREEKKAEAEANLPPEDTYLLIISGCEVKPGKKLPLSEACVLHLDFEIAEGEHTGKKLKDWVYVEYANPWSAQEFFNAYAGRDTEGEPITFDEDQAIGERVTAVVEHVEYNGNINARPTAYLID